MGLEATNPILDELSRLSPGAQAALLQAHQATQAPAQAPAAIPPPSGAVKIPAIGQTDDKKNVQSVQSQPAYAKQTTVLQKPSSIPAPEPAPSMANMSTGAMPNFPQNIAPAIAKPVRGTLGGDEAERQRLMSQGSGISQIHNKIEDSKFGQNHPTLGKILGWGAQIPLQVLGGAVGTAFPGIAAGIPGTQMHHNMLLNQANNAVRQDEAMEKEKASTGLQNAEAYQKLHPTDKYTTVDTDEGKMRFDQKTGEIAPLTVNGQTVQSAGKKTAPVLHETDQGLMLVNPETKEVTPLTYGGQPLMPKSAAPKNTKEQLQAKLVEAQNKGDTNTARHLQQQLKDIDPLAENRISVSIQGQQNANNRGESNVSRQDVRAHDKAYVQPAEAVEKSYNMMDHAYKEYKAAQAKGQDLPTGAQSMLALSTHLATTFGNVKGARVTKDMIAEHLGARSISDDALVAVQKLTNGDRLSPAQWDAFHDMIKQSRNLSWQIAVKEANRKHIPVDFLPPDLQNETGGQGGGKEIRYKIVGGKLVAQ